MILLQIKYSESNLLVLVDTNLSAHCRKKTDWCDFDAGSMTPISPKSNLVYFHSFLILNENPPCLRQHHSHFTQIINLVKIFFKIFLKIQYFYCNELTNKCNPRCPISDVHTGTGKAHTCPAEERTDNIFLVSTPS